MKKLLIVLGLVAMIIVVSSCKAKRCSCYTTVKVFAVVIFAEWYLCCTFPINITFPIFPIQSSHQSFAAEFY